MAVVRIVALIVALAPIAAVAGNAATKTYAFPIDAAATDREGRPLYVPDDTLKPRVPELRDAGPRLRTCQQTMTIPASLRIVFAPAVVAKHRASPRSLSCTFDRRDDVAALRGSVTCSLEPAPLAFFDEDPADYFAIDSNTTFEEATSVRHALRAGKVTLAGSIPNSHRLDSPIIEVSRRGKHYIARFAGCGRDGGLELTPDGGGGFKARFVATGICE